jgi:HEAT repeat protein
MTNNNNWGELLADDSPDAQVDALRQISGQESVTGLTETIVALSGSSNDEVRMWSAEALETSVTPTQSDVTALIRMLESAEDGEICYWAATMLGRLGPDAVAAVDALETCLRASMYLPARERATWALSQIGPPAAAAVPALRAAAEAAPPRLQRLATEALRAIGEIAA